MNAGKAARMASSTGRTSLVAVTSPSASSVERASPKQSVNLYSLRPSITNETVFVASPKAIGRTPVASGSSVPPWPAFAAPNSQRTRPTALVEPRPSGLSSTTQPSILFLALFTGGASVVLDVARDVGPTQKSADLVGFVERAVEFEAYLGRRAQARLLTHAATEPRRRSTQRREQPFLVLAAQRHHERGGVAQVGADIDRRHRDGGVAQVGIAHVTALEELGQQMANLLADAQLTLPGRTVFFTVGRATPSHGVSLSSTYKVG